MGFKLVGMSCFVFLKFFERFVQFPTDITGKRGGLKLRIFVIIEMLLKIVQPVKRPHAFREFFERARKPLVFVLSHVSFQRVRTRKVLPADFASQRSRIFRDL